MPDRMSGPSCDGRLDQASSIQRTIPHGREHRADVRRARRRSRVSQAARGGRRQRERRGRLGRQRHGACRALRVHGELVEFLLDNGADPNAAGAGFTALHAAIMRRNEKMVTALLAHGADPNAPLRARTPTRRESDDFHFIHTSSARRRSGWPPVSASPASCACLRSTVAIRCSCTTSNTCQERATSIGGKCRRL